MSQHDMNDLIDEQELRDALRPLRPNRDAFEAEVMRRIEATKRVMLDNSQADQPFEESQWLRVAASVIPFSSFAKSTSGAVSVSLGKVSFGYRLLGIAALPATTVLLMVGATVFGIVRINRAQRMPQSESDSTLEQTQAIAIWWKQFGLLIGCVLVLSLVLLFSGYVLPVFIVFLASAVAMVSLVTRLGRAGMVDRRSIGGSLMPGLGLLAQVTQIHTSTNAGVHLLDQSLVQAVLLGTAAVLAILLCFTIRNRLLAMLGAALAVGFGLLVVGFFARSLWAPVTTETLKHYVESFDEARFHSASWEQWEVPAVWLQDSGVSLDLSKPRQLLESEIAGEQNSYILGVGFATNLVEPADLLRLRDLEATKKRLVNEHQRERPIPSLQQLDFAIRALVQLDRLTPMDQDVLESRLLATLCDVEAEHYHPRSNALTATKLLEVLGRPCDDTAVAKMMQEVIVEFQRTHFHSGVRSGGFTSSRKLDFSNALATAAVVELMEVYGVPDDVNIMALRSYLRPSIHDQWQMLQSPIRVSTKQRLERISEVSPLTWWDYIRYEPTLWMSLMVAMLCFYATVSSATRRPEIAEPAESES